MKVAGKSQIVILSLTIASVTCGSYQDLLSDGDIFGEIPDQGPG